jgi:hypothetical protein
MPGWGGYQPRKKTKEQLAVERRRALPKQFPGDISELVALAAVCRKKPRGSRQPRLSTTLLSNSISRRQWKDRVSGTSPA